MDRGRVGDDAAVRASRTWLLRLDHSGSGLSHGESVLTGWLSGTLVRMSAGLLRVNVRL